MQRAHVHAYGSRVRMCVCTYDEQGRVYLPRDPDKDRVVPSQVEFIVLGAIIKQALIASILLIRHPNFCFR